MNDYEKSFIEFRNERVPIDLLSFDGGGIKGLLSLRMLATVFQGLPDTPQEPKQENKHEYLDPWEVKAPKYIKYMMKDDDVNRMMWYVWAQRMDDLDIKPQTHLLTPDEDKVSKAFTEKKKWMDFSMDIPEDKKMIDEILKIDLAFEFYLFHVMAISGTSTGGLISGSIALGMTLTQLVGLYMDPNSCMTIFSSSWNPLRWGGFVQTKYTQDGLKVLMTKIIDNVAPPDMSDPTFFDVAEAYNKRLENKIRGWDMDKGDEDRLRQTLSRTSKYDDDDDLERIITKYKELVKNAKNDDEGGSNKRNYMRQIIHHRSLIYNNEGINKLNEFSLKGFPDRGCQEMHATRFLITARCENNDSVVIFDSEEPEGEDGIVLARKRLIINHRLMEKDEDGKLKRNKGEQLNCVSEVKFMDALLSTSAAPSYFPAHNFKGLSFVDGGVVANDPSLLNSNFAFRKFQRSRKVMVKEGYVRIGKTSVNLLRVGCGSAKAVESKELSGPQGGLAIISRLADLFMTSDSDRTDLLCDELHLMNPDFFKPFKMNATLDVDVLEMDSVNTVNLINDLFGKLDERLINMIAIPRDELLHGEERARSSQDEEDKYIRFLVENMKECRVWISKNVAKDSVEEDIQECAYSVSKQEELKEGWEKIEEKKNKVEEKKNKMENSE